MGLHIGLDFGTSTISASVWHPESDTVKVLPAIAKKIGPVPNAIFYSKENQHYLGVQAQQRSLMDPQHYVSEIKRELTGDGWRRKIFNAEKNAVDVATDIMTIVKENIERNFGRETIESVVITVPFAFLYQERMKILEAALHAELPVISLIEEPVAAALASGVFEQTSIQNGDHVLVFDFGGGTLDMTIFKKHIDANGHIKIEVITTDGDASFGGKDIDQLLIQKLVQLMEIDLSAAGLDKKVHKFRIKVNQLAEVVKKNFTVHNEIHEFFVDEWQRTHDIKINYETFNQWLESSLLYRLNEILDDMLFEVNMQPKDINHIILVGGSSYLRPVQQKLKRYFQKQPIMSDDLTTLVAKGAGIYCGMIQKNIANITVEQKVSHHIGLDVSGQMQPVLLRNTPYGTFSDKQPIPLKKLAIYQGNSILLADCTKIGFFDLSEQIETLENYSIQIGSTEQGMLIVRIYDFDQLLIELPMTVDKGVSQWQHTQ